MSEFRVIVIPPVGAVPLIVTVPVTSPPPITVDGERVMALSVGGFTVIGVLIEVEPSADLILALTIEDTGVVLTVNVAEVDPAGMVTDGGTVIPPLLDDRVIV